MPLHVGRRGRTPPTNAIVLDLSSRGEDPWSRFSPFFPHGGIPVPFVPGRAARSVEGIWQALLVFEHADVDPTRLDYPHRVGVRRASRALGRALGHRAGLEPTAPLLPLAEARRAIFEPSYAWVLEHRLAAELAELRALSRTHTVVLLDHEATRGGSEDPSRPQDHAALVVEYLGRTAGAAA